MGPKAQGLGDRVACWWLPLLPIWGLELGREMWEVGTLESCGKRPWRREDMQHGDIWHGQLGGGHLGGGH